MSEPNKHDDRSGAIAATKYGVRISKLSSTYVVRLSSDGYVLMLLMTDERSIDDC
jgi:hypothetical protein